jgi:hypothetical protein
MTHTVSDGGTAEAIRKLGFKRWYERKLIESHAYLITCFLCAILVAACAEGFSLRAPGLQPLAFLAAIAGGALVGWFSWRRYRVILFEAERLGDRSTCGQCGAYAKFDVLESGGENHAVWLRARCRKCRNVWTIP